MIRPVCKLFFGIIRSPVFERQALLDLIRETFGELDIVSPEYPFDITDYYEDEMGTGLIREFVSLKGKGCPEDIVEIKLRSAEIERRFQENSGRTVNIDPGYMDHYKIVLASFKEGGQKIYLGKSVWADMILYYKRGAGILSLGHSRILAKGHMTATLLN